MTRCSHHFCHHCIESLACPNTEWPCPFCRTVQRSPENELNRNQLVETMVGNFQNNRPNRNSNIDQNDDNGDENDRPDEQNEGPNSDQNNDQNNVPGNEVGNNNINLCLDHNSEFTVCKFLCQLVLNL